MAEKKDNHLATWGDVVKVFGRMTTACALTSAIGGLVGWIWINDWHLGLLLMSGFMLTLFIVAAVVTSQQLVHDHNLYVRKVNDCPICTPPKGTFRGGRFVPSGWNPAPWWSVEDVMAVVFCIWVMPLAAGFMLVAL